MSIISPFIGHDSALFDRLSIRLRVIHSRPIQSGITLTWTNPTNQANPGQEVDCGGRRQCYSRFEIYQPLVYTGEWQEVVISGLEAGTVTISDQPVERVWAGELIDIRLELGLSETDVRQPSAESEDAIPEAVEIDWIMLTGVEEHLQGELLPPLFTEGTPFGELFASPIFCSLGIRGVGHSDPLIERKSALGDLDGDGDLDLVSLWTGTSGNDQGWLMAYNDGTGRFERPHSEPLANAPIPHLDGADLDGNGRMDLMISLESGGTRILHNDGAEGFILSREFPTGWSPGLADADGDGDADLWLVDHGKAEGHTLHLYLNDGRGRLTSSISVVFQPVAEHFTPRRLALHLRQRKVTGMLVWSAPAFDQAPERYAVVYLNETGDIVQESLGPRIAPLLIRYVGDLDLDGDVDLVCSGEMRFDTALWFKGLQVMLNRGDGSFETVRWHENVQLSHDVLFVDLNGDRFLDPVFVDGNPQQPAVIVSLGTEGALPLQEGRYPLAGRGGGVLGGDVNGDGALDLVVLERSAAESGGVHVLLNRLTERWTAVEGQPTTTPLRFPLTTAYPNPFNPGVVIPFALESAAEHVSLTVYNTLGQELRRLDLGALQTGAHQVIWDGRDKQGKELSSGTYLYRLGAGAWSDSGKMMKSD